MGESTRSKLHQNMHVPTHAQKERGRGRSVLRDTPEYTCTHTHTNMYNYARRTAKERGRRKPVHKNIIYTHMYIYFKWTEKERGRSKENVLVDPQQYVRTHTHT